MRSNITHPKTDKVAGVAKGTPEAEQKAQADLKQADPVDPDGAIQKALDKQKAEAQKAGRKEDVAKVERQEKVNELVSGQLKEDASQSTDSSDGAQVTSPKTSQETGGKETTVEVKKDDKGELKATKK